MYFEDVRMRLFAVRANTGERCTVLIMDEDVPVQLKMRFVDSDVGVSVIGLSLSGLTVCAVPWYGKHDDAWRYLLTAGFEAVQDETRGFTFPARQLTRLAELAPQVRVEATGALLTLLPLLRSKAPKPASVVLGPEGELLISYFDDLGRHTDALPRAAAAVLLLAEIPFVATTEAWEIMEAIAGFPVSCGQARLNDDGYVEIATSRNQLVTSAPLPGLFRIDESHFGIPVSSVPQLDDLQGFTWTGRRPVAGSRRPPRRLRGQLASHVAEDTELLSQHLESMHAAVIVYPPGRGRRVLAVAATDALDAWPALVVCTPRNLWVWQRHFDLAGVTHSVTHGGAEARIITYLDLVAGADTGTPNVIIYDDICGAEASLAQSRAAMSRLALFGDAYRMGVAERWPDTAEAACAVLESLRPGEFDISAGLAWRYPVEPVKRATQHTGAYLFTRDETTVDPAPWRRWAARAVTPTQAQLDALAELQPGTVDVIEQAVTISSVGTPHELGPKVSAVLTIVAGARPAGRRVVVLTRCTRMVAALRSTLAAYRPEVLTEADGAAAAASDLAILRWETTIPDLRLSDVVVICEWPGTTAVLDAAVGAAGDSLGAMSTVVLHSPGTIDDRIAAHAAAAREDGVRQHAEAMEALNVTWALSRRW
jgi:hypothetical protein